MQMRLHRGDLYQFGHSDRLKSLYMEAHGVLLTLLRRVNSGQTYWNIDPNMHLKRQTSRRLKPNFAYQLKLMGDFDDRAGFERIGKLGRWRLPGQQTNYTDRDYYGFSDKAAVEAYILFDFIITDRAGNAVRNFALDSSLHVLWNAVRQSYDKEPVSPERMVRVLVDAADPWIYARPKLDVSTEEIWAEREHARYRHENSVIQLPPGNYRAVLALTEESMHSLDRDGGYWATAFTVPIKFEITPP